jgi:uncharacterized protein (DUF302 family)
MNASPLVALELPLKVLVWQDAGGAVRVSYTGPGYLAERFGIPADLVANISGLEALVDEVVG